MLGHFYPGETLSEELTLIIANYVTGTLAFSDATHLMRPQAQEADLLINEARPKLRPRTTLLEANESLFLIVYKAQTKFWAKLPAQFRH